jgi:transposase InsO family protein
MRFEEAYNGWLKGAISQQEAARILGVCDRTFRRYIVSYKEDGIKGLVDKRLCQLSHRRAPADEVMKVVDLYKARYQGWSVKHFYSWYNDICDGKRSYTWVKLRLQEHKLVAKAPKKGAHRKRRERAPIPGMMIHQDASSHEWVEGQKWDLVITLDDATNEHYDMRFVDQEGTQSSFQSTQAVIEKKGLFSSLYTDRGSHYWTTPEAGGKVDKVNLTQFGRAMSYLGIQMIAAYSPQARGRCERMFRTHQDRLPKELAASGVTDMDSANRYLADVYLPKFNLEFMQPAREKGSAFIPWVGGSITEILCEQFERKVGNDNCVRFEGLTLQIPSDQYRCHYVKATVRVHRYTNGKMALFYGPRKLAVYDSQGKLLEQTKLAIA